MTSTQTDKGRSSGEEGGGSASSEGLLLLGELDEVAGLGGELGQALQDGVDNGCRI